MGRPEREGAEHAEVFVLTRSAEWLRVRCDCPATADHPFERPLAVRAEVSAG